MYKYINKTFFLIVTLSFVGTGLAMEKAKRIRRLEAAKLTPERAKALEKAQGYSPMEAEANPVTETVEAPVHMEAEATPPGIPSALQSLNLTTEQLVQLLANPQELYNQYLAQVQERDFQFNQLAANPKADATAYVLAQRKVEGLQKLLEMSLAAHRGK